MLKITRTTLKHITPDLINVSWNLESSTENFADYEVLILQSETPTENYEADYKVIASGISPAYHSEYDDTSIHGLTNKFDSLVYRIRVVNKNTGKAATGPATIVSVRGDMNAKYIIRHRELVLNRLSGQKFLVYKKKTFGQYCTKCYDDTLQRTTIGKCDVCYGTGYVGGFYSPFTISAQINENPPRSQITLYGDWQDQDAQLVTSVTPILQPGDMIIDLYGRRWNIVTVRSTNKAMFTIAQQAQMRQMENDNILYDFPVPDQPW
jgi:hypothetical protein